MGPLAAQPLNVEAATRNAARASLERGAAGIDVLLPAQREVGACLSDFLLCILVCRHFVCESALNLTPDLPPHEV